MVYAERFLNNPLLLIFTVMMIGFIIKGAKKGMLRIIYGIVSWIFLIWFVNFSCGIVSDYLNISTPIPTMVQESIANHLSNKYEVSEQNEEGTGKDAVMKLVPDSIQGKLDETIQSSIDTTIQFISQELSDTAIHGISMIISIVAGSLVLLLLGQLVQLIGFVPVVRDVNRILGIVAGFFEGMLFTWLCMYLADCFPSSDIGRYIIDNSLADPLLSFIYKVNVIERIIGI